MTLKGLPNVTDIRTLGLVAAIDLASRPDAVGQRGYEAMERAFSDIGIMFRVTGDTIALTPPLIITEDQISEIDRKSTRLNSSHANISYAVFCLKKKKFTYFTLIYFSLI